MAATRYDQLIEQFHDEMLERADYLLSRIAHGELEFSRKDANRAKLVDADLPVLFNALTEIFNQAMDRVCPGLSVDLENQPARRESR